MLTADTIDILGDFCAYTYVYVLATSAHTCICMYVCMYVLSLGAVGLAGEPPPPPPVPPKEKSDLTLNFALKPRLLCLRNRCHNFREGLSH